MSYSRSRKSEAGDHQVVYRDNRATHPHSRWPPRCRYQWTCWTTVWASDNEVKKWPSFAEMRGNYCGEGPLLRVEMVRVSISVQWYRRIDVDFKTQRFFCGRQEQLRCLKRDVGVRCELVAWTADLARSITYELIGQTLHLAAASSLQISQQSHFLSIRFI